MILEHQQILSNLKKKIYHPVYFLYGDEPFYTDIISDFIEENVLTDAEKSFNQTIIYGKETDPGQLNEIARRLPMMANHQVVIVKEAQNISKFEDLKPYLDKPVSTTILVLAYKHKKVDKRKTFFKELLKHPEVVAQESLALKEYQVEGWMRQYLNARKLKVDAVGLELLVESLGGDMSKIAHEIDKLMLVKGDDKNITVKDIEQNIGISKEYSIFELCNALMLKDAYKSNKIVHYFSKNPKSVAFPMAMGSLYGNYVKLYKAKLASNLQLGELMRLLKMTDFIAKKYREYASKHTLLQLDLILQWFAEYDLKSKGVGSTGNTEDVDLLKELTAKILALK